MHYKIRCTNCGIEFKKDIQNNRCPRCQGLLEIIYRYKEISPEELINKEEFSVIRYKKLLPLNSKKLYSIGEGWTPLIKSRKLSQVYGLKNFFLKYEGINPTGSFVDRGSVILSSKILEFGLKKISVGFSPNFAISLSAYLLRFDAVVKAYLPRRVSVEKLYQLVTYGADINFVDEHSMVVDSNFFSQVNPYYSEGIKTIIFEIYEQLGGELPDFVFVPTGTGSHLTMIWKGLNELAKVGLIDELNTKLVAVQTEECSHIVNYFESGEIYNGELVDHGSSILDDLCVKDRDLIKRAVDAIKNSGGFALKISTNQIYTKTIELARKEGLFPEPSGAASVAGVLEALNENLLDKSDTVVTIITGGGLKDSEYIRALIGRDKKLRNKMLAVVKNKRSALGRTKHIILELLNYEDGLSIYVIWKKVRRRINVDISYTTILQHVKELEALGLIKGKKTRDKRKKTIYYITNKGKTILKAL